MARGVQAARRGRGACAEASEEAGQRLAGCWPRAQGPARQAAASLGEAGRGAGCLGLGAVRRQAASSSAEQEEGQQAAPALLLLATRSSPNLKTLPLLNSSDSRPCLAWWQTF